MLRQATQKTPITALYARLSKDDEQQGPSLSIENQKRILETFARDNGFLNCRFFVDDGWSGANFQRPGFMEMMDCVENGEVKCVITKDLSRMGRNYLQVGMFTEITFPKKGVRFIAINDGVDSAQGDNDLTPLKNLFNEWMVRDTSRKIKAVFRSKGMSGKPLTSQPVYGYLKGEDGHFIIDEEAAPVVRQIFSLCLAGNGPTKIARMLTEEGIPSPGGKDHWNPSNIKSILTNEKYKGDALLQKTFTVDFLTKKKKANEGEIPQYYVKDNHEAIIDPETFEMVQTLMTTRTKGRNRKSSVSIFSSKVKCGDCGSWYGPKVWHSNDAYRKVIWQCNHKFDGQKCATPTLTEDEIKELFLRAANQVIDQKEQFIAIYDQVLSRSLDTTALESELSDLEAEINIAAELIEDCIKENAHVALDQDEYQKRYDALVARFDKAKARHTEVTDLIAERMARKHQIEAYLKNLRSREPLTEFRETDWLAMVDYIAVHSKNDIRVTFKDGTEIET